MNDIRPPKKRPLNPVAPTSRPSAERQTVPLQSVAPPEPVQPIEQPSGLKPGGKKRRRGLKIALIALITAIVIAVGGAIAAYSWYQGQLRPVAPDNEQRVRVVVESGMGPKMIGALLKKHDLIHSTAGFDWYTRLTGTSNVLQAGTYSLSQSMSLPDIISHLKDGKTDTFTITFLPGATVADNKKVLKKAGYSQENIDAAFEKQYDHPLFATKPASADLEGYVYGETYQFAASATVEDILTGTFDQMYKVIEDNGLVAAYKKQGLSLYEGITLASIVQREEKELADQKQVAQVFYLRLEKDMPLGSDPTYQYIADKTGQPRDPGLDSPYNTRKVAGLPPGPISMPGESALLAVAQPAKGDYLYFLNGDDNKMHFAHTQEEHEQNIAQYCKLKCQIL